LKNAAVFEESCTFNWKPPTSHTTYNNSFNYGETNGLFSALYWGNMQLLPQHD